MEINLTIYHYSNMKFENKPWIFTRDDREPPIYKSNGWIKQISSGNLSPLFSSKCKNVKLCPWRSTKDWGGFQHNRSRNNNANKKSSTHRQKLNLRPQRNLKLTKNNLKNSKYLWTGNKTTNNEKAKLKHRNESKVSFVFKFIKPV